MVSKIIRLNIKNLFESSIETLQIVNSKDLLCSILFFFQSVVPPPPPMPPPPELGDPSETRPFMDPYGRAKTVRIGKWRWPPPKDDNSDTSFLQFKMKQRRKHSQVRLQFMYFYS